MVKDHPFSYSCVCTHECCYRIKSEKSIRINAEMEKGKDGILATLNGSAIKKHRAGEKLKYYRIQDV
jgi:hypothetical protein